jgi:hypothetical protein
VGGEPEKPFGGGAEGVVCPSPVAGPFVVFCCVFCGDEFSVFRGDGFCAGGGVGWWASGVGAPGRGKGGVMVSSASDATDDPEKPGVPGRVSAVWKTTDGPVAAEPCPKCGGASVGGCGGSFASSSFGGRKVSSWPDMSHQSIR